MFQRLFLTYLLLVGAVVGLVGAALYQRAEDLFYESVHEVAAVVVVVFIVAGVAAYVLARRFTRPLHALTEGARRIAAGDFDYQIRSQGARELAALADAFNAMSRRLAETFDLLEHDREQLRAILSGMVEGVIAIDEQRRIVFANDRAGELLGFNVKAVVHQALDEMLLQPGLLEIIHKGLSANGPYRQELEWKGPPPRNLGVYVSRFPGHGMPGAVIVLHDTTELRQAERLRQDFVANVSHELKTPLAVIKSSVETLVDGAAEEPESRQLFLQQIVREADRLEELIKDLLTLARIEGGHLRLEPQAIPLDRAISECLERHHPRAENKTLTLVEKPPKDGPADVAVWADADALQQILDNLVDNAIKYTPNGGRITVRWSVAEDTVSFEVEDTGVGIPAADLPRVFERFYRVDKARSRAVGGTGLGLAIVKHLVQAMKGQVRVSSSVGKGTTFRVTLPRAHPLAAQAVSGTVANERPPEPSVV
ncbi:MAG: cell wall metabolism sensor histidine kinase WalK [Gemmataceae bacterium]|nr:cell wall metabolism sensor histidine kinase WalK [Gemmataceae bacterium]